MVVARYSLSQTASCQVMKIMWQNCKSNIGPMRALKSYYTAELCDQKIEAIHIAEALPDEAARTMIHEMIRTQLVTAGRNCTRRWKRLKLYINGIYKNEEERKIQYKGAGWDAYESATSENWQSVEDLMQSGMNYISENTDTLKGENNDNMPEAFPESFTAAWIAYKQKWDEYISALADSETDTAEKVNSLNSCYQDAVDMGADGQTVFEDDEALQKQFSFEAVGRLVEPGSPASLEVTVEVNGVAKAGAELSIAGTDKAAITGTDGKGVINQMRSGTSQCLVECDGYTEQLLTLTLDAGVRKRITVSLQPLFEGALSVGSEKTETVNSGNAQAL